MVFIVSFWLNCTYVLKKHYVYCLLQFAKIDIILNLKNVLDITK